MGPGNVTLMGTFLAGILSFVSPCVLPLTPIYLAQLVGPAIWEGEVLSAGERAALRRTTMLHAVSFVAGFSVTFIALGATASELGTFLSAHALVLRQVGGIVLVVLGLQVAGILSIPWLNQEKRLHTRVGSSGYPASFLIGLIFAIGWTPCVGPILAGVLILAGQAGTLGSGVLLLAVYSLGLGIPFLALGFAFDRFSPMLKRLTPHLHTVELVTGGLLMVMGLVIFFNWLLLLNKFFVVPGLG